MLHVVAVYTYLISTVHVFILKSCMSLVEGVSFCNVILRHYPLFVKDCMVSVINITSEREFSVCVYMESTSAKIKI